MMKRIAVLVMLAALVALAAAWTASAQGYYDYC